MAFCKSSSCATNSGTCVRCHRKILSNGPALVFGNSLFRHLWAPAIKWVMAITSTIRSHRVGRYCNLSSNRNSWWLSWYWFTSIVIFHCPHQLESTFAKTAARKHTWSLWWTCSWKNCLYVAWHSTAVLFGPGIRGQLYSTLDKVVVGFHFCLRGQGLVIMRMASHGDWWDCRPLPGNSAIMYVCRYLFCPWKSVILQ